MITWNILQAAVLYVGFFAILGWRFFFPWQTGKTWRKWFNHFTLLYGLITILYIAELATFFFTAHKDLHSTSEYKTKGSETTEEEGVLMFNGKREWPIHWLRWLVLCVPAIVPLIIFMTAMQSRQHLKEIQQDSAQLQHDRVINILALPAVYAVVTFSGLARVYSSVVDELHVKSSSEPRRLAWSEAKASSFAEYETCLFVGDLYEAWALYQFGKLTVELLENALPEDRRDDDDGGFSPSRGIPQGLSVQALSRVLWLGTGLFIAVNMVQAGWALYMWLFQDPALHWETFEFTLSRFSYAGLVASAAAIYNVHIIESTFGHFIKGYAPFLKFLSVKIIVFFAFWQGPTLSLMNSMGIFRFTDVQIKLLQAALIVFECLLCACLHVIAWGSQEQWYAGVGEKTPLLDQKIEKNP